MDDKDNGGRSPMICVSWDSMRMKAAMGVLLPNVDVEAYQSSGIHYGIAASPSQKQLSASSVSAMHLERGVESDDIFNQYD